MLTLLDTHIAYWIICNNNVIPQKLRLFLTLEQNQYYFSDVSIWEIDIKHKLRPDEIKLSGEEFYKACIDAGLKELPISKNHIFKLSTGDTRKFIHKDPFDKLLLATAEFENMTLITCDSKIGDLNIPYVSYYNR